MTPARRRAGGVKTFKMTTGRAREREPQPLRDEITVFLTEMAASGAKPIEQSTPGEVRALSADLKELYGAGPQMARVEEHTVSGADGGSFVVRVFVQAGTPRGGVIYYHGGGWGIGGIDEFD